MKNYIIIAVVIILIIVGVVWYKAKSPAPVSIEEMENVTETLPLEESATTTEVEVATTTEVEAAIAE